MPKLVAFLRAVNVGGRTLKMDALKQAFAKFGGHTVETFLASGNVIFESHHRQLKMLESEIEQHLKQEFKIEIPTFVRKMSEVAAAAEEIPFAERDVSQAEALNVGMLKKKLTKKEEEALQQLTTEIDRFAVSSRQVYWLCARKQSESDFSNAIFERRVASPCTFRTIRTLDRIKDKFG